jgi:hypothetical protein
VLRDVKVERGAQIGYNTDDGMDGCTVARWYTHISLIVSLEVLKFMIPFFYVFSSFCSCLLMFLRTLSPGTVHVVLMFPFTPHRNASGRLLVTRQQQTQRRHACCPEHHTTIS